MVRMDPDTLIQAHIATVVREHFEASRLGVNEAADLSNIPRTTFKRHLNDGKWDSWEIVKLARALGTTVGVILSAAEEKAA